MSSEYVFPIFISSAVHNLVDLRAELANFLDGRSYRPILSSDTGFPDRSPNLEPWESCLPVLDTCFVVVLIIDGRYGTQLEWPNYPDLIGGRSVSPTHGEYLFAHSRRKRMLVFVRDTVMHQYQNYREAMKSAGNDRDQCKALLAKTMPKFIDFKSLELLHDVKTTRPIPWITEFKDVTTIKREIDKKMLGELANLYLFQEEHFRAIIDKFTVAISGLSADKQKEIFQSIAPAKEMVKQLEANSQLAKKLQSELKSKHDELVATQGELDAAQGKAEKQEEIEGKLDKVSVERDKLRKQLAELQRETTGNLIGKSYGISATTTTGTTPNPSGTFTEYRAASVPDYAPTLPLGHSGTINVDPMCSKCTKTFPTYLLNAVRVCPSCGQKFCQECWPDNCMLNQVCDTCQTKAG